jgi:type IV pilus assembly protein PilV
MPVKARMRGFTLMEVMVALVVSTIGLLGLAKMESLALSSTSVASSRSLSAILASSMGAAMHANPGYWQSGLATTVVVTSGSITGVAAGGSCLAAGAGSCTPQNMAYYDLTQWQTALGQVLQGYVATITCSTTTGVPVTCSIQLQWAENAVAANTQQSNMTGLAQPTYTLLVQP